MASNYFRIKKGLNVDPQASSVSVKGDIGYNSVSDKLEVYNGAVDPVVTETKSATLTNKSMDATANTFTNIANTSIATAAAIDFSKLAALTSGNILVGSASNVATSVAMSGDTSIIASGAVTVNTVGGATAADIATASSLANAATDANTPSTIVKRDASGNFSAGTITATLNGNATNVTGVVDELNGGTAQSSYTTGDILYSSATNTLAKLPIGLTNQVLTVIAGAPSWVNSTAPGTNTFNLANNQTSFSNVTGFLVDPTTYKSFTSESLIQRYHTNVLTSQEDTTFYTALGTGFNTIVWDVKQTASSDLIIGGVFTLFDGNTHNRILKLSEAGVVDSTFATNVGTGFDNTVFSIAEQSNTDLVIGGEFTDFDGNTVGSLVRLSSAGVFDSTFDGNLGTGFDADINSLAIQTDQKIVVGGSFANLNGSPITYLARLNSNGTLDSTFQSNLGTVADIVRFLVIQPDQKIVAGLNNGDVIRINTDGTPDTTFNTNVGAGGNNVVRVVAMQGTQILVGGDFTTFDGVSSAGLARLNANGTLDTTFSTNIGTGLASGAVNSFTIQQGKIVVGGFFTSFNGNTRNYIFRLNSDGTEDTDFYTAVGGGFNNTVQVVLTQANEQLLIGGYYTDFDSNTRQKLIRFELSNDVSYITQATIKGVYNVVTETWTIGIPSFVGNYTGVSLQMTDLGQMQYTSTNLGGNLVDSYIKFQIVSI